MSAALYVALVSRVLVRYISDTRPPPLVSELLLFIRKKPNLGTRNINPSLKPKKHNIHNQAPPAHLSGLVLDARCLFLCRYPGHARQRVPAFPSAAAPAAPAVATTSATKLFPCFHNRRRIFLVLFYLFHPFHCFYFELYRRSLPLPATAPLPAAPAAPAAATAATVNPSPCWLPNRTRAHSAAAHFLVSAAAAASASASTPLRGGHHPTAPAQPAAAMGSQLFRVYAAAASAAASAAAASTGTLL